jgi:sensor histidine kinase YesM
MHEKNTSDTERESSGIGFKNVMERLKLIYPGKFQASFNGDGKEFFVQLSIQP